jgi:iron(III) transport system substrate-binding protein
MFHMTYDKFGRAFQEKLATQELAFARDYQESVRRVARGEYPISNRSKQYQLLMPR